MAEQVTTNSKRIYELRKQLKCSTKNAIKYMLLYGLSTKEIARELGLKETTVDNLAQTCFGTTLRP